MKQPNLSRHKKRSPWKGGLGILLLLIVAALPLGSCGGSPSQKEGETLRDYHKDTFLLPDEDGYYNYCEVVVPEQEGNTPMPMVFIAHGYSGTINSGGAAELCERLASHGIVALRIDFNKRTEPEKDASTIDEYTLESMIADGTRAMDYVVANYAIDTDRIGVYGRSMGGRVAMTMANQSRGGYDFKALFLVAPAGNSGAMIYYMGGQERWDEMKAQAATEGYATKQGLKLRPEWFQQFEAYDPSADGASFGDKPVYVVYNTLDHVVTAETSKECAAGYQNCQTMEVTTEDGHGYEMSLEDSELKEQIMEAIVAFFSENL